MYPNFKNLCIGTYGGPNTHKPFLDHRVSGSASDGALVDCWSNLPADVLEKVLLFIKDPCKTRLNQLCSTNRNFREVCKRDAFWYTLCKREGWTREDRTTAWHAMPDPPTETQWKDQFFKWCELRFEPSDSQSTPPKLLKACRDLGTVTNGTCVWANLEAHLLAPATATPTEDEIYERKVFEAVQKYGPIESWDVSRVTNMNRLFQFESMFAGDISLWDVLNVKSMDFMFDSALEFNSNISNWNVSNVEDMSGMFCRALSFNQYIGRWDVSSVKNMCAMFLAKNYHITPKFNQDISNWNVSNVEDMSGMFFGATAFTKDLTSWGERDLQQNLKVRNMFFGSGVHGNEPEWYLARVV